MTMLLLALALAAESPAPVLLPYQGGNPGPVEFIGRVVIGKLPPPKKFSVKKNADKCGREKADLSVQYSGDGGLANAVVWIDGIRNGKDVPKEGPLLRNISCTYEPRVVTAVLGSTLEIKNYDALPMIAFALLQSPKQSLFQTALFQTTLPVKGLGFKRKLESVGVVNVHGDPEEPWATAWVYVFDHPYAAVSDEGGYFSIDKLPEGEFVLHAWHENYGEKQQALQIKNDGTRVRVDLRYD